MGLRVLARDANRRLVVFPDDATLARLRNRIETYTSSEGRRYRELAAIEAIEELGPEDRIGPRLRASPLRNAETEALDVELWHPGSHSSALDLTDEIRSGFAELLEVTDQYVGASLCLLRVRIAGESLTALLSVDYVKEVDRRPIPWIEIEAIETAELGQYTIGSGPRGDRAGVVVIDSGVAEAHPLLQDAIADAAAFPSRLAEGGDGIGDGDTEHGHGTSVAGIAVFGDVAGCMRAGSFEPLVPMFAARVTTEGNEYDPDELVESQLREAVEYFTGQYPQAKVINISLGDGRYPYGQGDFQFRLAALIDELAYEYRDRELVFVVSAGNYNPLQSRGPEGVRADYPMYLLEPPARVIDPATSAIAMTVGGISPGEATIAAWQQSLTDRDVAAPQWPSPFTRAGPGIQGSIKPELVELAGTFRFARGRLTDSLAGVPTTSHSFAPPEARLLHMVVGTSFAAPRVSHIAARLFQEFPGISANLVRALLADSARIPDAKPPAFASLPDADEQILRIYGYGQADYERARWSSDSRVVLVDEAIIDMDSFRLYEIPPLPDDFASASGNGYLSVALAFDPPTRHTRSGDYLGVSMEFALFKNVAAERVAEALRRWDPEEQHGLQDDLPGLGGMGTHRVHLEPGSRARNKGTLQRGVERVASRAWRYEGTPMVLAVTCRRRWAAETVQTQRYAVVVSVRHSNPLVPVYTRINERARVYERARVRITR